MLWFHLISSCGNFRAQFPWNFGGIDRNSVEASHFQKTFHNSKLGEIMVFYAVKAILQNNSEELTYIKLTLSVQRCLNVAIRNT